MFKLMVPTGDLRNGKDLARVLRLVADHVEDIAHLPVDTFAEPYTPWRSYVHETPESTPVALYRLVNFADFAWQHPDAQP